MQTNDPFPDRLARSICNQVRDNHPLHLRDLLIGLPPGADPQPFTQELTRCLAERGIDFVTIRTEELDDEPCVLQMGWGAQ